MPPLDEEVESGAKSESIDGNSNQTVGHSHPPIATRFRKGQSGNPKGRPKGAKNFKTLVNKALNEKVTVNENGKRKAISKMEAGAKHFANKVASGDIKTIFRLSEWEDREGVPNQAGQRVESGPVKSSLPASATALEQL